jgi:site-specific DNA-methyltransferase (cytosine-N4-specific)
VNLGDKYSGSDGTQGGGGKSGLGGGAANGRNRIKKQEPLRNARGIVARGAPAKSLIGIPWRYALACIDELGLILRAEVIWNKPNALPESVTDRVKRSHEQWFHLVKEPRYFSAIDEVREPHLRPPNGATFGGSVKGPVAADLGVRRVGSNTYDALNPLGKLPGSVWTVPTQPLQVPAHIGVDHFAAFPMEFPRRIIKGWSPAGGVVLDPFGGTGTTALVASTLGRVGISVDLSHDYSRLAKWRTTDPGERARALQVEKPPAEVDGQADLFGGAA